MRIKNWMYRDNWTLLEWIRIYLLRSKQSRAEYRKKYKRVHADMLFNNILEDSERKEYIDEMEKMQEIAIAIYAKIGFFMSILSMIGFLLLLLLWLI